MLKIYLIKNPDVFQGEKNLSKNKEYNDLKSKKRKIYDKYPEIMHLIEDSVPMTFDVEKVQAFDSFQINPKSPQMIKVSPFLSFFAAEVLNLESSP